MVCPPGKKSGDYANVPLPMWVVRVWEARPPRGQERLEWFLLTNEPVQTFKQACRVVGWYECRWVVEEFLATEPTQFIYTLASWLAGVEVVRPFAAVA